MSDHRDPAQAGRLAAGAARQRRLAVHLLTAVFVTALAGCGTSVSTSSSSASSRPAPKPCRIALLEATITDLTVAAGNVIAEVSLRNTSATPCTMNGYPRVTFANVAAETTGTPVVTTAGTQAGPQLGRAPAPAKLTLASGASAVSWISWSDSPAGTQTEANCVRPTREIIEPPSQRRSLTLSQHLSTVTCGRLTVEPVEKAGYTPNPNQLGS
jgi:hypothetical protein